MLESNYRWNITVIKALCYSQCAPNPNPDWRDIGITASLWLSLLCIKGFPWNPFLPIYCGWWLRLCLSMANCELVAPSRPMTDSSISSPCGHDNSRWRGYYGTSVGFLQNSMLRPAPNYRNIGGAIKLTTNVPRLTDSCPDYIWQVSFR